MASEKRPKGEPAQWLLSAHTTIRASVNRTCSTAPMNDGSIIAKFFSLGSPRGTLLYAEARRSSMSTASDSCICLMTRPSVGVHAASEVGWREAATFEGGTREPNSLYTLP